MGALQFVKKAAENKETNEITEYKKKKKIFEIYHTACRTPVLTRIPNKALIYLDMSQ